MRFEKTWKDQYYVGISNQLSTTKTKRGKIKGVRKKEAKLQIFDVWSENRISKVKKLKINGSLTHTK